MSLNTIALQDGPELAPPDGPEGTTPAQPRDALEWYAAGQVLSFVAMTINLSKLIRAPIDEVYAFFNDPANTTQLNTHAVRYEVVDTHPDGRRTYDVVMRAGSNEWMQTVEELVRDRPTRLVTRGGSWTTDRQHWLLTITTDRRFSPESDGTRVDVTIDTKLGQPLRRLAQAIRNWLWRGAAKAEFERQLALVAERLETRQRA